MEPELIKKFYTYIDKKFEKQEAIIQKIMVKHNKDVLRNIKIQKQKNKFFKEKTILTIKAIILIILNFLVIFIIIWMLSNYNSEGVIIKTIDIFSSYNSNDGYKEIINWIIKKIIKFSPFLTSQIISLAYLSKYFPSSKYNNNENIDININYDELYSVYNELSENQSIISEILDNISEDLNYDNAYNILNHLNDEYSKREEMLSKIELETEKILEELGSDCSFNELPKNYKEEEIKLSLSKKGLIISSSLIGTSIIISRIFPYILEIIFK